MNLIPIDELVEIWVRVHKEALAKYATYAQDNDLSWWREACQYLHPDAPAPEDNEILNEESGEQTN